MTEDPVTVDAVASPHEAARAIVESHHNHLPVVEHGQLESLLDEAPSERELRLARGFGFTAVAIGLLLALGILIGLLAG